MYLLLFPILQRRVLWRNQWIKELHHNGFTVMVQHLLAIRISNRFNEN